MDTGLAIVIVKSLISLFENRRKEAEARKLEYPEEMIAEETALRAKLVELANSPIVTD